MSIHPPFCATTVRHLARQLTWRAVLGLLVLAGVGASAAVAAAGLIWLACCGDAAWWGQAALWMVALTVGMVALRAARWLGAPGPQAAGIRLSRGEAPALHQLADVLAKRMGARPVDAVHITAEMNAAVHQRPRWGAFGPMRTTLVIGLPLILSIAPEQLTAILAHETGHLARQRRGIRAWAAHWRTWWHRACDRLADDATLPARVVYRVLARWSAADVRGAVRLNHLEEYEADWRGARVVGARVLGDTLLDVAMKANFISQDYWAAIMAQADERPQPGRLPFRDMGHGVAVGFRDSSHAGGLACLADDEPNASLHPSLGDRLAALCVDPLATTAAAEPHGSAAAHFLQDSLDRLCDRFDQLWWDHVAPSWRAHYDDCTQRDRAATHAAD